MLFNLLLFAFGYFNAILSSHVSFLFPFLLVFVLLVERKEPRCSNSGIEKGEMAGGKPVNGDIT